MKIFTWIICCVCSSFVWSQRVKDKLFPDSIKPYGNFSLAYGTVANLTKDNRFFLPTLGVGIDFNAGRIRYSADIDFLVTKNKQKIFSRIKSPDFTVGVSYVFLRKTVSDITIGPVLGVRTGALHREILNKKEPTAQDLSDVQSTFYIGPALEYRYRLYFRKSKYNFFTLSAGAQYGIDVLAYASNSSLGEVGNWTEKVRKSNRMVRDTFAVIFSVGWSIFTEKEAVPRKATGPAISDHF
jgi:hypothetical protein